METERANKIRFKLNHISNMCIVYVFILFDEMKKPRLFIVNIFEYLMIGINFLFENSNIFKRFSTIIIACHWHKNEIQFLQGNVKFANCRV